MIPEGVLGEDLDLEIVEPPTRTYRLDVDAGRITGWVDGPEAMMQAVQKILTSDRYETPIWSGNYGSEVFELVGQDPLLVHQQLEQMVTEALMMDDRVLSVDDFETEEIDSESLAVSFVVNTSQGEIPMAMSLGGGG